MSLWPKLEQAPHTNYSCTSCSDLIAVCEPIPCVDPAEFRCFGCMEAAVQDRIPPPGLDCGPVARSPATPRNRGVRGVGSTP